MATKYTNMWNTGFTIGTLTPVLTKLAIGDTKHDFGYSVVDLKSIRFKTAYNSGIPQAYVDADVVDEEDCLKSVVKEVQGVVKNDYVPMNIANPRLQTTTGPNSHTIKTINEFRFSVNYCIVKDGSRDIDALEFYEKLELDTDRNIAIIVDAASIGLYEILNNGDFTGRIKPKVYYIYGPEVVNDPATKKGVDAKEFSKSTGVELIPCLPVEIPIGFESYNYSFSETIEDKTPYLQQFITNYTFKLTDLKTLVKGKSKEYITNLTIYGDDVKAITLPNSKSKNDITFLSSILNRFLNLFKTRKSNTEESFLFAASLQQKRSGDWLQVLLCAALKDKLRKFKNCKTDAEVNDIQDVYFVTHDRIALAFALLNGINCIFTHHHSANHLHSCFVYKLQDAAATAKANRDLATTYKGKLKTALNAEINALIIVINTYMETKYDNTAGQIESALNFEIDSRLGTFKEIISTSNPATTGGYKLNMFSLDVRSFFQKALKVVFAKSIFPDLRDQLNILNKLILSINGELAVGLNDDIIIQNYRRIKTTFDNIRGIYTQANQTTEPIYNTKLLVFTKSEIYKRAINWTWDINLSSRDVAHLADPSNPDNYNTDRNIFLYNINELNESLKQKLTTIYYEYYEGLLKRFEETTPSNLNEKFTLNDNTQLNERYYVKFRAVSITFCVEVLLTLGENGVNIINRKTLTPKQINDAMEKVLSKNPKTISTLLKDDLIVDEDNEYNSKTSKYSTDTNENIKTLDAAIPGKINEAITDDVDLISQIPIVVGGAVEHISESAFPISIKQVTYPIMTLIFNNSTYFNKIFAVFGFVTSTFSKYTTGVYRIGKNIKNPEDVQIQYNIGPDDSYVPTSSSIESLDALPLTPRKVYNRREHRGGGKKNLESLFKSLPPLEDDTPIERYDEDIFKDNSICFHPLLPIYMLTQSYMTTVENEDIEESMDFDLFVNYLKFLKKIKENVVNIYSSDNTNETKLEAYAVGLGLKQLLFVSNNDIDGYEDCLDVLDADPKIYSKASSFTDCLCNSISGKIEHDDITLVHGPIYLKSDLFRQFARQLHVNRIFGITVDATTFDLNKFKREIFEFSKEVAEQIINDRKSSGSLDESVGISITESLPDQQNKFGLTKEELERQKEKRETATKQYEDGIKVPKYKPQNITDASSFFEKENKKNPNRATEFQTVELNSTSPTIRRGGKSRKIKKQKRTKRKNKKINRKTRRFRKTRKY